LSAFLALLTRFSTFHATTMYVGGGKNRFKIYKLHNLYFLYLNHNNFPAILKQHSQNFSQN